jgi:hypothetical protein
MSSRMLVHHVQVVTVAVRHVVVPASEAEDWRRRRRAWLQAGTDTYVDMGIADI